MLIVNMSAIGGLPCTANWQDDSEDLDVNSNRFKTERFKNLIFEGYPRGKNYWHGAKGVEKVRIIFGGKRSLKLFYDD